MGARRLRGEDEIEEVVVDDGDDDDHDNNVCVCVC